MAKPDKYVKNGEKPFDWKTFDMDRFFKDANKVGDILRRKDEEDQRTRRPNA